MLGKNIAEITQYKMSFLAVPHMPCVHVLFEVWRQEILYVMYIVIVVSLSEPTLGSSLYMLHVSRVQTVRTVKYNWQAIQVLYTLQASCVQQWTATLL